MRLDQTHVNISIRSHVFGCFERAGCFAFGSIDPEFFDNFCPCFNGDQRFSGSRGRNAQFHGFAFGIAFLIGREVQHGCIFVVFLVATAPVRNVN
ncbi:hypothetical protein D3C86_1815280 [compost metagenome]